MPTQADYEASLEKQNIINQVDQMLQILNTPAGELPAEFGITQITAICSSLAGTEEGFSLDSRIPDLVHDKSVAFYTDMQTDLTALKTTIEGERDTLAGIVSA